MIVNGNSRTWGDFKHTQVLKEVVTTQAAFKVVQGLFDTDEDIPKIGDVILKDWTVLRVDLVSEMDEAVTYRFVVSDDIEARIPSDILIPEHSDRRVTGAIHNLNHTVKHNTKDIVRGLSGRSFYSDFGIEVEEVPVTKVYGIIGLFPFIFTKDQTMEVYKVHDGKYHFKTFDSYEKAVKYIHKLNKRFSLI